MGYAYLFEIGIEEGFYDLEALEAEDLVKAVGHLEWSGRLRFHGVKIRTAACWVLVIELAWSWPDLYH